MTMQRDDTTCHRDALVGIAHQAMVEKGLAPDFDKAVEAQLATLTAPAGADEPSIRDLRDRLWCSIDNDDSRDLDQLTVAEDLGGGRVRLLVAVADVDALVKKGTPIDAHAQKNTTSVYTAGGIFPMLPEKLSTNLTSLNEGEDRLALVIEMTVRSDDGSVEKGDVYRARVHNRAQLAYDAVGTWLEGGAGPGQGREDRRPRREPQAARTRPPTACARGGTRTARWTWRRSRPGPSSRTATSSTCARSGATTRAC